MYVAFVGSRVGADLDLVRRHVAALAVKYPDAVVVSGGAKGVDSAAVDAALVAGLETIVYLPKDAAGESFRDRAMARNSAIVERADVVMAYPSQPGRGTRDSIRKARRLGRRTFVYEQ